MAPIIAGLVTKFANAALKNQIRDDDLTDQLNHWATTGLLTALAIGIGAKQYVGEPIHCWVPAEYKSKHFQQYSDSYCWIYPMYNVPFDDAIPFKSDERWFNDIGYYRWVFIMFLLQAFLFKFPNIVWTNLKNYSGLNVSKVVQMAWDAGTLTQDKKDEKMGHMAIFIDQWLKTYSHYKYNVLTRFRDKFSYVMFCFGRRAGTYLSGLYMFIKLLYCANVIGQFFLLSAFLDVNFWTFGFSAMKTLNRQGNWQDHYNFPRIGLCDYKIRQLQNIQTFTVQCVLSINLFLEKMYLILWFWLFLLLIFNFVNLIQWMVRSFRPHSGETFLMKYVVLLGINANDQKKIFFKFVHNYLRADGMFMLRIMAINTSEMLVLDLIKHLWENFKESHNVKDNDDDTAVPNGGSASAIPSAPVIENNNDSLPPKKVN